MSDRLHCPGCGIPTIEGGVDTTEEELYCNRCVEELERNMSTNKPAGGAQFTPVCACQAVREYYDTGIGGMFEDKVRLCPFHAAAPAMYEALQSILEFYEWSNSNGAEQAAYDKARAALAQAEGRQGLDQGHNQEVPYAHPHTRQTRGRGKCHLPGQSHQGVRCMESAPGGQT